MIRKQLYLEEAQDQALKQRAKELRISEAELVRQALDTALRPTQATQLSSSRWAALRRLLDNAKRLSATHSFPEHYRFEREALYREREDRWLKRH